MSDIPAQPDAAIQAQLALLIGQVSDAVMLMDEDFRITYANPKALEISQITAENFNRETLWELYPGVLESPLGQAYLEAVATREVRDVRNFYYEPLRTTFALRIFPMEHGVGVHYRDVTAIHEAEDRLAFALQASNGVGVWDWDIVNDRVYSDAHFATLYGVTSERGASGTPLSEFTAHIHPDDMAATGEAITKMLETGGDFYAEYRLMQPDGSDVWVGARGRPILDDAGRAIRFPGVTIDITEQKQRDELLRISEARYRALTELSPQSQWTASPEGLVLYANQRFLEYIGYQFVPKTGKEYIECFDERDRERVVEVWTHCVTTGEDYNIEARLLRASDSASRWWNLRAVPIRGEQGRIEQWLGTASDIHEERLASNRLREQYQELDRQRRELEAIYRGSPIGMALYEPKELRLTRINDRQAEIFRLPTKEAIGKTYDELAGGVTEGLQLIRRAAAGEPILNHSLEGALSRHPEEYRYWNINYSPIFAEDGSVCAIASATIELTAQKRAELALIQSEKLAAVGRMASSIAHEINNPLESVTNLIYLARSQALVPAVQEFLDTAEQELRRVSIIANQTLRFHKQATRPTEVSASALFQSVLSLYEGRLKNSHITVEKFTRTQLTVACFEGDIRQVLNNLVSNAIDAMAFGSQDQGGRLLVRSRAATDWRTGRKGLTLTIADTGSGISPEARARLFEAFYTTKGFNGTGLGLWISAEIIERHQGRILLRSSQAATHHGTVFSIFLPFDTAVERL